MGGWVGGGVGGWVGGWVGELLVKGDGGCWCGIVVASQWSTVGCIPIVLPGTRIRTH